jgi:hypothetical protein
MSADSFHSELEPLEASIESTNGFGPHDDDAATEPGADSEPAVAATAETSTGTHSDADPTSPDFLARLADAMRQTVESERSRVSEEIDRRRAEHLAAIATRRESEATRMRELAAGDRAAIETWAEGERQRIQKERDERLAAVDTDLATSLDEHGKSVDEQIGAVEAAIAAHRTSVDAFFGSLGSESDPVRIAQLAGQRPASPDLNGVSPSAAAQADAAAEAEAAAEVTSDSAVTATSGVEDDADSDAAAGTGSTSSAETDGTDADVVDGEPVMAVATDDDAIEPVEAAADEVAVGSDETTTETDETAEPVLASAQASQVEDGVPVMDSIARLGLLKASDQAVETALPRAVPAGAWRPGTDPDQTRSTAHAGGFSGGLNAIGWFRRRDDSGDR